MLELLSRAATRNRADGKPMVGMVMLGMGDGSHFWGPVNGILCIFCAYLDRLARAVPSNLRTSEKLQRSKMYVVFGSSVPDERER